MPDKTDDDGSPNTGVSFQLPLEAYEDQVDSYLPDAQHTAQAGDAAS